MWLPAIIFFPDVAAPAAVSLLRSVCEIYVYCVVYVILKRIENVYCTLSRSISDTVCVCVFVSMLFAFPLSLSDVRMCI